MAYALCGIVRAGRSQRDPVEALSNGGIVTDLLAWASRREKATGQHRRQSLVRRAQRHAARASHLWCDLHSTTFAAGGGMPGSSANVGGASRFNPGDDVGVVVEDAPGISPVSVQMWDGVSLALVQMLPV
jgi:hypothetical protein